MVSPKDIGIDPQVMRDDFARQLEAIQSGQDSDASQALLIAAIEQLSQPNSYAGSTDKIESSSSPLAAGPILAEAFLEDTLHLPQGSVKAPDLGDRSLVEISAMDPDALKREIPVGSISPAVTNRLFVHDELRVPVGSGFVFGLSLSEIEPAPRKYAAIETDSGEPEVSICLPAAQLIQNILPVPFDCKVSFASDPLSVSSPTADDPFSWRAKFPRGSDIEFAITQGQMPVLKDEQLKQAQPSAEEQAWVRATFPLPEGLKSRLEAATKGQDEMSVFELVSFYMQGNDPRTGLSNFRYVNHKAFGQFLRDNAEESLPLIVSALKVGHCDLLSWYAAAILRGYGVPAWASSEMLPTKDGQAFNGSYAHARVVFAGSDGVLKVWDPTTSIKEDSAYSAKNLTASDLQNLQSELSAASADQKKWDVLLKFKHERDKLRGSAIEETVAAGTGGWAALAGLLGQMPSFGQEAKLGPQTSLVQGATIDYAAALNTEDKIIALLGEASAGKTNDADHLEYLIGQISSSHNRGRLQAALNANKALGLHCHNMYFYKIGISFGSSMPHLGKDGPFVITSFDFLRRLYQKLILGIPFDPPACLLAIKCSHMRMRLTIS